MKKRHVTTVILLALVLVLFTALLWADTHTRLYSQSQFAMDTVMSYKLYGKNAKRTISELQSYVSSVDKKLSLFNENSEIFKINSSAGENFVTVSEVTFELLSLSKQLCEKSNGSIDITVAPLTKLWEIGSGSSKIPTDSEIERTKQLVNYKDVLLNGDNFSVKLQNKNQAIDLGGFAKGYVCEKAVEICKQNGIKSGIVAIGGNIAVIGKKPNGQYYTVGIRTPQKDGTGYFLTVEFKDKIIATSGGYERYFEKNGKTYEHIMDLSTGYPVESDLMSVSVISQNGLLTDAYSTMLYVQGLDAVKSMLSDSEIGIIAVDKNKAVYVSEHLKDCVQLNDEYPDYYFAE